MNRKLDLLISRIRFRKLRNRILLAMIFISLPSLFILGYISIGITKNTLEETNTTTFKDQLLMSNQLADIMFKSIINTNRSIVFDHEIRNELRSSNTDITSDNTYITTHKSVRQLIKPFFYQTAFANSICLINLNFEAICDGRSDDLGVYKGKPNKAEIIRNSVWYQRAYEAQGRVVFLGYDLLGEVKKGFSTVKLFRDADTPNGKPIGLLVITISESFLNKIFERDYQNGGFMVIDDTETSSNILFNGAIQDTLIKQDWNSNETVSKLKDDGYLITQKQNNTTGWNFIHAIREKDLFKQSKQISFATTVIASAIGIFAIIISVLISNGITSSFLQIKKMIIDWYKGGRSFNERIEDDEIGAIGNTFKRLMKENHELTERLHQSQLKEGEAELKSLQAQIKPHFLYNTLDSIYWMAVLEGNQDIAKITFAISEIFKLSLNKGKEVISVFKELKNIEHYLTIQNIRYKNRFEYIQDVEPSIMGMDIMKLMLQPLVENAIYHGLEQKLGNGTVKVSGRKEGNYYVFTVEDDGVGIEDINTMELGYGISNVRDRLKLFYGPDSMLVISSEKNKGTKVEIRFKLSYLEVKPDV